MSRLRNAAAVMIVLFAAVRLGAKPIDHWVAAWATGNTTVDAEALAKAGIGPTEITLREIAHPSLGGPAVRLQLTNEFGTEPLIVSAASVALAGPVGSDMLGGSAVPVTFNGLSSVSIPPGSFAVSDQASLAVGAFADIAVSINLPAQKITHGTAHLPAVATGYLAQGDHVMASPLPGARKFESIYFLKALDVKAPPSAGAIVALGDSITGGAGTAVNAHARYPDALAERLQADPHTAGLAVINEGIGGNRVLRDGAGPAAIARIDHDVLSQSGVRFLILIEGAGDIARATHNPRDPADKVTAEDIIGGLTQIADRAHARGIKVIGATLNPNGGRGLNPAGDEMREKIDTWVRTNKVYDGYVDELKALQDPANPGTYLPVYDRGDHVHCSPTGYKAMADAFDLKLFYPGK